MPVTILTIIHLVMTSTLFIYLFLDAKNISKKEAIEAIPFLFIVSNIWIIYWCWFIYDNLTKDSEDES